MAGPTLTVLVHRHDTSGAPHPQHLAARSGCGLWVQDQVPPGQQPAQAAAAQQGPEFSDHDVTKLIVVTSARSGGARVMNGTSNAQDMVSVMRDGFAEYEMVRARPRGLPSCHAFRTCATEQGSACVLPQATVACSMPALKETCHKY